LETSEFSSLNGELAMFTRIVEKLKTIATNAQYKLVPSEIVRSSAEELNEGIKSFEFHLNTVLEKTIEKRDDLHTEKVKLQREVDEYEKETEADRIKDGCVNDLLKALADFDFRGGDALYAVMDAYRVYKVNCVLP
jgi:hypothetical protein